MKYSDMASLSDEALVHLGLGWEHGLVQALIRQRLGKLSTPSSLKQLRRDIARAKTELTRRETAAGLAKGLLWSKHASSFKPQVSTTDAAGSSFLQNLLDAPAGS